MITKLLEWNKLMNIQQAELIDLPIILQLQKITYLSEAQLLNNYNIPPLTQTLTELEQEFHKGIVLKATDETNTIIGSIRAYQNKETLYIGKLMVHPTYQNKGIGGQLLLAIESYFPKARYELFTSDRSLKNLSLYTKNGYKEFKRETINNNLVFVFLEKIN